MRSPVMFHDYLFIAQDNRVLVFNPNGRYLDPIDYYITPDEVLVVRRDHDDLLVITQKADYIICGGPNAASMYMCLLRQR